MAQHKIAMHLPKQGIQNLDVEIVVRSDDEKLGTLKISKGSIDWLPAKATTYTYKLGWERFAELMEERGNRRRK